MSESITDAIIEAHKNGIVTSTTLMPNMPATSYAADMSREWPSLGIGVHLTLTQGKPLLPIRDTYLLTDENGNFLDPGEQARNLIWSQTKMSQIEKEFSVQIQKIIELGIQPTHLDSHHHIARMPLVNRVLGKLAKKFRIPGARAEGQWYWCMAGARLSDRVLCVYKNAKYCHKIFLHRFNNYQLRVCYGLLLPDRKIEPSYFIPCDKNRKQQFIRLLENLPYGVSEITLHPRRPQMHFEDSSSNIIDPDSSLATDNDIVITLERLNIKTISFAALR